MTDPARPIDAVIDHAAALQQQVDRLSREMATIAVAGLALSLAIMVLSYRLWRLDG